MSTLDSAYECTPRQVAEYVEDCIYAGLVPFVQSSPGIGKSSIIRQVCNKLGLDMIDHRASTSDPTDYTGLPSIKDDFASFKPFEDIFPLEHRQIPKGKQGWGIFLDEFNSAPRSVQAAAYKLVLDRKVGQHSLHPNCALMMAGNLATDKAITVDLSTAMQSRVIHILMRFDFTQFYEDVMLAQGWDSRIMAYLNWKNENANNFRPDHTDKTFACPRTWEFMNRMIQDNEIKDSKIPLYVGTLGAGVALDFVQFTQVFSKIPDLNLIRSDPESAPMPGDNATRWAIVSKLMDTADASNVGVYSRYIKRFSFDMRMLFGRGAINNKPQLRSHPDFINMMADMSKYLHAA